jgi:mRNA-degrading endonuclease RelE of RelBE toxin-antitoxin system
VSVYKIEWRPAAIDQLTSLWITATNRAELSDAVQRLDRILSADPYGLHTQDVSEGLRGANAPPLRVLFTVSESDRQIRVLAVRIH